MRITYLGVCLLVGSISCNGGSSISDDLGVSDLAMAGEGTDLGSMNDGGSSTSGRIIFQCPGSNGGVCIMNADGSNLQTLVPIGFQPYSNAAGEILYYTISGTLGIIQKRSTNGTIMALGNGGPANWMPTGSIVFQCPGSSGGICTMNADGSNRQTLVSTGFQPDGNAAGEILYYTVSGTLGTIQKRLANGSITALANGSNPHWVP